MAFDASMTRFKVVTAGNPELLEEDVNALLSDGWELHGTPLLASTPVGDGSVRHVFTQAMVLRPDTLH